MKENEQFKTTQLHPKGEIMNGQPILYSTRESRELALSISKNLSRGKNYQLYQGICNPFADGEVQTRLDTDTRGRDVFIIGSTHQPDRNLIEILALIRAARKASAKRITAVIPYFGYGRADYKDAPRVCPTTRLICDLLVTAGVDRILTVDFHSPQIQEFFPTNVMVDQLYASSVFYSLFHEKIKFNWTDYIITAPDNGAIKVCRKFMKKVNAAGLAYVNKNRLKPNITDEVYKVNLEVGQSVEGKNILILDDMIDTGGTIVNSITALKEAGANLIQVAVTHGVLSGDVTKKLLKSPINGFWTTNSIPTAEKKIKEANLPFPSKIIDLASLLAEAIKRIHEEKSISSLIKL